MRKVRYNDYGEYYYTSLRNNRVYDVIRYIPSEVRSSNDSVEINVDGVYRIYNIYYNDICFFEDVTHKYRNDVIDGILK